MRKTGYLKALKEHHRLANSKYLFRLAKRGECNDYESGYKIGKIFCLLKDRPDAMFIFNDLSALGFEKPILDYGLKVPSEVVMDCIDNI